MSETGILGYESLRIAWNCATGLVRRRPWLTISWIAHPEEESHLVVHDGATGPALHFDDEAGPTFASAAGLISLEWEDVTDADDSVDWAAEWGPADEAEELTPKTAVYQLLSALVALGPSWSARPARFIGDDADPSSIYGLRKVFPTIVLAVASYAEMLEGQYREGELAERSEYWHEPMWLLLEDGIAAAMLDESGFVHLPSTQTNGPSAFDVMPTLRNREWEIEDLTLAMAEGAAIDDGPSMGPSPEPNIPRTSTEWRRTRVYIDFASIMTKSDWDAIRRARAKGTRVEDTKLLSTVGREFADAFGEMWWSIGPLDSTGWSIEWTLHIGDRDIGAARADLLYLAASEQFVGYFFGGGRLLVDRLGSADCDIYVTRGATAGVRSDTAEVIRVGTEGFEDWHAVARYCSQRARH